MHTDTADSVIDTPGELRHAHGRSHLDTVLAQLQAADQLKKPGNKTNT
jgi:hypothetical protein